MEYTQINNTKTSRLGFGCMRFPLQEGSDTAIDEAKALKMIDRAIKSGITYFDTAYPYHGGTSEEFTGRALSAYPRDSFTIATKLPVWKATDLEGCKAIFEEQLKKLRVDYFDFYLIHALNKERFQFVRDNGVYEYLMEEKKRGRIRNLGFSFHDNYQVLEEIASTYKWDFAQIQFNYVDYVLQNGKEEYQILTDRNIPVVVMEPVRGGSLSALGDNSIDPVSLAFRFVKSFENIKVVLSGMSAMEHVDENVKTFSEDKPLTSEEMGIIEKMRDKYLNSRSVACTACGYCQPCTKAIEIPKLFALYNELMIQGRKGEFLTRYPSFEHTAPDCIECNKCVKACPQKLEIPKKLKEVASTYKFLHQ